MRCLQYLKESRTPSLRVDFICLSLPNGMTNTFGKENNQGSFTKMTRVQTSPKRLIQIYIFGERQNTHSKTTKGFRDSVLVCSWWRTKGEGCGAWRNGRVEGELGTSRDSQDGRWCTRGIRLDEAKRSYRPGKGNERESDGRWRQEKNARMMINFGLRGDTTKQNCFPYETGLKKKGYIFHSSTTDNIRKAAFDRNKKNEKLA